MGRLLRCFPFGMIIGCLATLVNLGCASPAPRGTLPLQAAPDFSPSGESVTPDAWWTSFGDNQLNEHIDLALTGNFSLVAAWERLREARAVTRRESSALYPMLDARAGAELLDGRNVSENSQLSAALEASYEVDLWGRIDSLVQAERFRAAATAADYQTTAITLSAEVASTWYQLGEARQQLDLINSQVETNTKVLNVLERRFEVGQSGSADVLRQLQLVEATREQALIAQARIEVFKHQLAVLEGRPPQANIARIRPSLPIVPALPSTGLPAELLQRRPDIRSAFWTLEASDADVAAAVSDQYPRIDLLASLSTRSEYPADLFDDWLASLLGQVIAPLFDGGLRRAEVEQAVAVRRQRLAEYGQIVLNAFRDVEDALSQEAYQIERIASLQQQLGLANRTYQQLRSQYLNGAADYLDVLAALREQQQLERTILSAELARVLFRISLYRALAGGFVTAREADERFLLESSSHDEDDH